MKLLYLKLRGAIGIQRGTSLDEIEIDFSQLSPGLVAITGRNGSGKTTLIENMHPYRCYVSRSGSLTSQFFLKDSCRQLIFEHDGYEYESLILIDALTGASEAYLRSYHNGYWGIPDCMLSSTDGKLKTYDEAITNLLGSQELFFSSVFSGQKSKGIAQMKPAERRQLFYELLNLDKYDAYCNTAKTGLKAAELQLADLQGSLKANQKSYDLVSIHAEMDGCVNSVTLLGSEILQYENLSKQKTEELSAVVVEQAKLTETTSRNKAIIGDRMGKEKRIIDLNLSIGNAELERSKTAKDYADRIDLQRKLTASKDMIQRKLSEIEALNSNFKAEQEKKAEHEAIVAEQKTKKMEYEKAADLEAAHIKSLKKDIENHERALAFLQKQFKDIEQKNEFVGKTPCAKEIGRVCSLLSDAYDVIDSYESVFKDAAEMKEKIATLTKELAECEKKHGAPISNRTEAFACTHNVDWNMTFVNGAKERIYEINAKLAELNKTNWAQMAKAAEDAENKIAVLQAELTGKIDAIEEKKRGYQTMIEELKSAITNLNSQIVDVNEMSFELNLKQTSLESEINALNEEISTFREELKTVERRMTELESIEAQELKKKSERERISELIAKVQKDIQAYNFLVRAFDKTGIPVLKLENSGIEITNIANGLLDLFENKFRIIFNTTKLSSDKKKQVETFDINILDDAGICEISNKSGGQQVWLETALQLAISLLVRRQGRDIKTAFLDEKDGALDLDNALTYMNMLQKAHELSNVHNTFVITHRAELMDLIPQQISFADGFITVNK